MHIPQDTPPLHAQTYIPNAFSLPPVVFPEPSLTPENLSTVLDIMSDSLWRTFGDYINIRESELGRIEGQCTNDRECKQALIHTFLSSHPAPSWALVAWALYMTESEWGDGSCLRALDHLQQLFPTGTVFLLVWYTLTSTCSFICNIFYRFFFFFCLRCLYFSMDVVVHAPTT